MISHNNHTYYLIHSIVCIFSYLQSFVALSLALGFRKATSTVIEYPGLVLTPVFSFWTFGAVKLSGRSNPYRRSEERICLSFRLTWINAVIQFCGMLVLLAVHETWIRTCTPWTFADMEDCWLLFFFVVSFLPTFVFTTICHILIQTMDKCSFWCKCCKETCFPMTEKRIFYAENAES